MRLAANVDLPGSNHMEFVTGKGHRPDRKSTGTHRTTSIPRVAGAGIRLLVALLPALAMGGSAHAQDPRDPVKIGMLAKRGTERCLEKWGPTAEYLTDQIPGRLFVIVPLGFEQVCSAVERGEVDFVFANPSFYVELEARYGMSRLATLKNLCPETGYTQFGGVIFQRADRDEIKHLIDLKGKTFMAVAETSFGGWQMAWREMKEAGIDPQRDLAELRFGGTHDAVVYAVRDGLVDAGTVRTDTLERIAAEGKIRLEDFRVVHPQAADAGAPPLLRSTRLYPEWSVGNVKHTHDELGQQVAVALLSMPADSPAAKAARCTGWTIPQAHQSVRECLKTLRVGPYKDFGKVTLAEAIRQYWPWLVAAVLFLAIMTITTLYVLRLNRRLTQSRLTLSHELSERRRTEENLQKSEEKLEGIVHSITDHISMMDEEHNIVWANDVAKRLFGSDLAGRKCYSAYHGLDKACEPCVVSKCFADGESHEHETEVIDADGKKRAFWCTASVAARHADGRPKTVVEVSRDITERKQAERALNESEAKFRTLYESTDDAIILLDENGFFDCNDATLELYGIGSQEEFCRTHPGELSPPLQPNGRDSMSYANSNIAVALKEGHYRFEHLYRRADGTEFPADVLLNALELGGKTVLQAVVRDITERKRSEERLRESEERHRAITETAQDAIIVSDPEGKIRFWNSAAENIFGFTASEAIDRNLMGLIVPPQYHEAKRKGLAKFSRTGLGAAVGKTLELTALRKDGVEFPIEISISRYRDQQGYVGVALVRDISARKQSEDELRIAKEMAEATSRTKSEFLANMSHEIRTPMTAILGFTDVLLEHDKLDNMSPGRIEAAKTIKRNGEYLLQLVNDILDLSKIEAGKMRVEWVRCSPCRIVAEVTSLARVRADAKGLPLNFEYIGAIPETIQTDPTRLRQILINVISNAIKFTEVGSVRLVTQFMEGPRSQGAEGARDQEWHGRLGREEGAENTADTATPRGKFLDPLGPRSLGPFLQFDVIDTGLGMTEEQVARLFQPFMQADASTTRRFGGTGLGLVISKRLAALLGGDIVVVETQKGVGTRIRVTVATGPLKGVKMIEDPLSATVLAPDKTKTTTSTDLEILVGYRILLAEDGPDNQRLIAHVLRKSGADVTIIENGKLAVDAALAAWDEGKPFDLILMDMQMPVMDGYQATNLLRQKGYTGSIIALTAHAMASDREKCINAGCNDYATKPINRKQLITMIRRYIDAAVAVGTSAQA